MEYCSVIAESPEEFYCMTQQQTAIANGLSEQEFFVPVYTVDIFTMVSDIWFGCKFIKSGKKHARRHSRQMVCLSRMRG